MKIITVETVYLFFMFEIKTKYKQGNKIEVILSANSKFRATNKL